MVGLVFVFLSWQSGYSTELRIYEPPHDGFDSGVLTLKTDALGQAKLSVSSGGSAKPFRKAIGQFRSKKAEIERRIKLIEKAKALAPVNNGEFVSPHTPAIYYDDVELRPSSPAYQVALSVFADDFADPVHNGWKPVDAIVPRLGKNSLLARTYRNGLDLGDRQFPLSKYCRPTYKRILTCKLQNSQFSFIR
jgi:hypothetical protein